MDYLHLYQSVNDAIGTSALTPYVGAVNGNVKVVYASSDEFGVEINLVDDGEGFFKASKKTTNRYIKLSANGNGTINTNKGYLNIDGFMSFINNKQYIFIRQSENDLVLSGITYYAYFFNDEKEAITCYTTTDLSGKHNFEAVSVNIYAYDSESKEMMFALQTNISVCKEDSDCFEETLAYESGENLLIQTSGNVYSLSAYDDEGNITLTSIEIPTSMNVITTKAFAGCTSLSSVTLHEGMTSIYDYAFSLCDKLSQIEIPSTITFLGEGAFQYCKSISSIIIPNGVTEIFDYLLGSCESLTSCTLPNSITSIGNHSFDSCHKLSEISIPNSVISIGKSAFFACESLKLIKFNGTVEEWNNIEKGEQWHNGVPATVVTCTDGTVDLD